jgi:pimeloyl-ACP methyl ester carboxylesterase
MMRHARRVLRISLVALVVLAVLTALAWGLQRKLIYFPSAADGPAPERLLPDAREVTLHTKDGLDLGALLVPPAGRDRHLTVLVTHGNAGNRTDRAPLARRLAEEGFAVLLFDYRGYGGNEGSPSEKGLAADADAAYRYLVSEAGVPADRLILFGESIGSAVATGLATRHRPAGLVLRSPFTSLAAVGGEHYPWLPVGLLLRDKYPVAEQIRRVDVPTAVVYGTGDTLVPPSQSRAVAEAAGGKARAVAVRGADHNDLVLVSGDQVIDAVVGVAADIDATA